MNDTSAMNAPMSSNRPSDEPVEPLPAIEVHLFAAARSAAEADVLVIEARNVHDVLAVLAARGAALAEVLKRCSLLVNGSALHGDDYALAQGDRIDVLPPFAGG